MNPQEACEEAVMRIVAKEEYKDMQVGYLAIDKNGNYGAYAIHPGFNYALYLNGNNECTMLNHLLINHNFFEYEIKLKLQCCSATLVTVFFFWGFIAASNGVFIPFLKVIFI